MINLPNFLTLVRFAMVPLFGILLVFEYRVWAFVIYGLACGTDILDGYLARRHDQVTQFGRYMDPLADKLLQLTALTLLAIKGNLSFYIPVIVVVKEVLMIAGGFLLYKKVNFKLISSWYGKLAAALVFLTVAFAIFGSAWSDILALLAVAVSLYAFARYLKSFRQNFSRHP